MIKRLLVATDFSTRSDRAVRRASLLARRLSVPLTLVHVVDADQPMSLVEAGRDAAALVLGEWAQTLRDVDGVSADWLVRVDEPEAGILAAADEIDAGLIAIGPHRSRLANIFTGTTSERIVQRATRPVLVATETPSRDYSTTLLALDFDEASRVAAQRALAMGIFGGTQVILMHAYDAPAEPLMRRSFVASDSMDDYVAQQRTEAAERMRQLASELGLPPAAQAFASVSGSPAHTILQSAQELGADLVVLGTNQRTGIARALIGSVTADVIREQQRDVLIIPVDAGNSMAA